MRVLCVLIENAEKEPKFGKQSESCCLCISSSFIFSREDRFCGFVLFLFSSLFGSFRKDNLKNDYEIINLDITLNHKDDKK